MQESDNKYIRKGIHNNPFGKLLKILDERAKKHGIEINKIDRYYPSSKTCSRCKAIKNDLKLSDRVFNCPNCG